MGYAFISYSTQNTEIAYALKALFEKNHIETWIAPNDIPAGYKYPEVINQAVRKASCLVLLLSEPSQASTWVAKEVERAIHYRRPVIPVQIDDVVLNDEFEFYISTNQIVFIQKVDEHSEEIQKLLTSVTSCVNTPTVTDPKTTFPFPPSRYEELPLKKLIDGKYEVMSFEGDVGNAAVYRVAHKYTEKTYILLLFSQEQSGSDLYPHLFSRLNIPGLAQMLDIVQSGKDTYYVFSDIHGQSLSEYLVENYEMPEANVIQMGLHLCDILCDMEDSISREILDMITPASIFANLEGQYTIIPVGLRDNGETSSIPKNLRIGEQFYYAPEKLKSGISSTRTAIYALGAVLYAAVVGRDPAREPHVFYPLRKRNSTLSEALEQIILKCMDPNPDKRYQSFHQLHKQLTRLANGNTIKTRPSLLSFFKRKG